MKLATVAPRFYPVTGDLPSLAALTGLGFEWIQWRAKAASGDLHRQALELHRQQRHNPRQQLILNDDAALALELGFDGVHLGQLDLAAQAPSLLLANQRGLVTGISVHNFEEAVLAIPHAPSYLAVGPLFRSSSKPALRAADPGATRALIAQLRQRYAGPLIGIGGIDLHNCRLAFQIGLDTASFIHWNQQIIAAGLTPAQLLQAIEKPYDFGPAAAIEA